jgi:hypothetical protein
MKKWIPTPHKFTQVRNPRAERAGEERAGFEHAVARPRPGLPAPAVTTATTSGGKRG